MPSTEAILTIAPGLPTASMRLAPSCAQANTASRSVAQHAPPFGIGHFDRPGEMCNAGVVDEDGDGAECRLHGIEAAADRVDVGDIGSDGERASARRLDPRPHRREPLLTARQHCDRGPVRGEHLGKARPQPGGGAGDERHPAGEVEQLCPPSCGALASQRGCGRLINFERLRIDDDAVIFRGRGDRDVTLAHIARHIEDRALEGGP